MTEVPPAPLTWREARERLRGDLEEYLDAPVSGKRTRNGKEGTSSTSNGWMTANLDLYLGAFPLSVAMLALSSLSLDAGNDVSNRPVYRGQVVAAAFMVVATMFSIVLVIRRQIGAASEIEAYQRIQIEQYLSSTESTAAQPQHDHFEDFGMLSTGRIKNQGNDSDPFVRSHIHDGGDNDDEDDGTDDDDWMKGTSLTDVYPVYRRFDPDDNTNCNPNSSRNSGSEIIRGGRWTDVPAMLLVKGDYIGLQVGDIVPAKCRTVVNNESTNDTNNDSITTTTTATNSHTDGMNPLEGIELQKGERITPTTIAPEGSARVLSSLPKGRTTIPPGSPQLLQLCNMMTVCTVIEPPLPESLRRRSGMSKPSAQVHRKVGELRTSMTVAAVCFLVVGSLVTLSRKRFDVSEISLNLQTPVLAAVALLPTVTPLFLVFVEILGTSRILVAAHSLIKAFEVEQRQQQQQEQSHGTGLPKDASTRGKSVNDGGLLRKYFWATLRSRLGFHRWNARIGRASHHRQYHGSSRNKNDGDVSDDLLRVPAACFHVLEKLGVVTAFTLVDDELACEPFSVPQQLLIPSGNGLKLLDLCRVYDGDDGSVEDGEEGKAITIEQPYSDSEEDEDETRDQQQPLSSGSPKPFSALRRRRRFRRRVSVSDTSSTRRATRATFQDEVEFEDPNWWQHLPSLKCIGLASLFAGKERVGGTSRAVRMKRSLREGDPHQSLVEHVSRQRRHRKHLQALAKCIGFSSGPNSNGPLGDVSAFTERRRMHVVASEKVVDRVDADYHALALEDSRGWGAIRSDATSIIIHDKRSKANQLLTVGDPSVVLGLCSQAWQGENTTILPFNAEDRSSLLTTSTDWALSDLDVLAFSYSPIARTRDGLFRAIGGGADMKYLLDHQHPQHRPSMDASRHGNTISEDWALLNNQIFLGVLGSSITPRKEIEQLLMVFGEAGVRFVYFSPRNMRRTKEVASQMGIDVAWNCAISLRPLDDGQEDPHRMVSNYADWDVKAKLPHGIEAVRRHLQDVDNVPLLVSLYTDVTKKNTGEMLETFQEYGDTVLACGLSHFSRNANIFWTADIAIGVDALKETTCVGEGALSCHEMEFVTAIASTPCALRLRGASSTQHIPSIIEVARAALDASSLAGMFVMMGCVSFALFCLFSLFTVSTTIPYVPVVGSVFYLHVCLPLMGLAISASNGHGESMKEVPPKNEQTFAKNERYYVYSTVVAGSLLPAILPQFLWMIAFVHLLQSTEPSLVEASCGISVLRCHALRNYSGRVLIEAGSLALAEMAVCVFFLSASLLHRTAFVWEESLWTRNKAWAIAMIVGILIAVGYVFASVRMDSLSALPWYFYVLAAVCPFLCLAATEYIKRRSRSHIKRAILMRRLQFETRLGMWSPK